MNGKSALLHGGEVTASVVALSLDCDRSSTRRRISGAPFGMDAPAPFWIGPENELLIRLLGLADGSGDHLSVYSPLYLHAPSGGGKTHLLHAVDALLSRRSPQSQVLLLTGRDLVHAVTTSLKVRDLPELQRRFQRVDALVLDNVQELAPNVVAQEQLATILDHRNNCQRVTIVSGNSPIHQLKLLARLQSRLSAGLVLPLRLPSCSTRRQIVEQLETRIGLSLDDSGRQWLAEEGPPTVPELLGLLHRIKQAEPFAAGLRQATPLCGHQIAQLARPTREAKYKPQAIIQTTARFFGLRTANLTGPSRRRLDVLARSVAIFLIRQLTELSFQRIGRLLGNRDHTTILHAFRKIEQQCQVDDSLRASVDDLYDRVRPDIRSSTTRPAVGEKRSPRC